MSLIVSPKRQTGVFQVWSKIDRNILVLDFRPILDYFKLWNHQGQICHYRAMPKHLSGWGLLDIPTMSYQPDYQFDENQVVPVKFLAHPDKTLTIRPTNVCLIVNPHEERK